VARTTSKADSESLTLSPLEAQAYFDAQVRELLGISGAEFLHRLDAGEYADMPDDAEHADIVYLATFQFLARRDS
jgi:hypothetical protein